MTAAGSFLGVQQANFSAFQARPKHHMQPAPGSALQLWSKSGWMSVPWQGMRRGKRERGPEGTHHRTPTAMLAADDAEHATFSDYFHALHCSFPPASGRSAGQRQQLTFKPFQSTELVPLQLERLQAGAVVERADILQVANYISGGPIGSAGLLLGTYANQTPAPAAGPLRAAPACSRSTFGWHRYAAGMPHSTGMPHSLFLHHLMSCTVLMSPTTMAPLCTALAAG